MIDDSSVRDSSSLLGSSLNPYTTNLGGSLEPPDLITANSALNSPLAVGASQETIDIEARALSIGNSVISLDRFGEPQRAEALIPLTGNSTTRPDTSSTSEQSQLLSDLADPLLRGSLGVNLNPTFDSGVFVVGNSGNVSIDFLFDGGKYKGELAIFSLDGIEELESGSEAFIQEAVRRALSDSELGHIVISDSTEGAKFSGILGKDLEDWNAGEYSGIKTFSMRPGDKFGFMLVPNGTVQNVFDNPGIDGSVRPLFSMATANPNDTFHVGQIADVVGDGTTFVMEDLRVDTGSDRDYDDFIFRVDGATGYAALLGDVIAHGNEWQYSKLGQQVLTYVSEFDSPDKDAPGDPTYPGLPTPEIPIPTVSSTTIDQGGNGFSDLTGASDETVEPNQAGALPDTPTVIEASTTGDVIDQVSSVDPTDIYEVPSTQLVDTEISVLSGNASVSIQTPTGEVLSQQVLERGTHILTVPEDVSGEVLVKVEQGGSDGTYMVRGFESQAKEPFNIDVEFGEGLSASQKQVVQAAAKSVESLIGQGLPSAIVDGKIIDDVNFKISATNLDGASGTLAQTKIDFMRYGTLLPAQSITLFDAADLTNLESAEQLFSVVQHEILHGLGFGNLWEAKGLVDYAKTPFSQYTGEKAIAAFQELGGVGDFISLETEGNGSADLHWNENLFQDELMTRDLGFETGEDGQVFSPISPVTLASLADLGYQVNLNRATPDWGLFGEPPIQVENLTAEQIEALQQLAAATEAASPSDIPIIVPAVDPATISPEIWAHAEQFKKNGEYYKWELERIGNWREGYTLSQLVYDRMTDHPSKDQRSRIAKALDPEYWQFIIDRNAVGNIILDPNLIYENTEYWLPTHVPNYEQEQEEERKRRDEALNKKLEEERKERERLEEIYRQKGSGGLEWWLAKAFPDFGDKAPYETSMRDVVGSQVPDDYFRFTLSRPGGVEIYLGDLLADADLYLYDSRNRLIQKSERSGITDEKILVNLEPGTYLVRVHSANGLATDYNLNVRFNGLPSRTQIGNGSGGSSVRRRPGATFADPRIEQIYTTALNQFAASERQRSQAQINNLEAEKRQLDQKLRDKLATMNAEQRQKVYAALDGVRNQGQSWVNSKANDINSAIDSAANRVLGVIDGAIPSQVYSIRGLGDRIRSAQGNLKGAINGARSWLKDRVNDVQSAINNVISGFIEGLKNAYMTGAEINSVIDSLAQDLKGNIDEQVRKLNNWVNEFNGQVVNSLGDLLNVGTPEINLGFSKIPAWNLYNIVAPLVDQLASSVKNTATSVSNSLKGTVDFIKPLAQGSVAEIVSKFLGDETGKLYNQINGIDQQIADIRAGVERALNNQAAVYKRLLDDLLNKLGPAANLISGVIAGEFNSNKTPEQVIVGAIFETVVGTYFPLAGSAFSARDLIAYIIKYWGKPNELFSTGDGRIDLLGIVGSLIGLAPLVGPSVRGILKLLGTKGDDLARFIAKMSPEFLDDMIKAVKQFNWDQVSKFSQNSLDSLVTAIKQAIDGIFNLLDEVDNILRQIGLPQFTSRVSTSGKDFRLFLVKCRDSVDDFSEAISPKIDGTVKAIGYFIEEFIEDPTQYPRFYFDLEKALNSNQSQKQNSQP